MIGRPLWAATRPVLFDPWGLEGVDNAEQQLGTKLSDHLDDQLYMQLIPDYGIWTATPSRPLGQPLHGFYFGLSHKFVEDLSRPPGRQLMEPVRDQLRMLDPKRTIIVSIGDRPYARF